MKRRGFFRSFLGEAAGLTEELRGNPQLRLSEVGGLPDETFLQIVPIVCDGVRIDVNDEGVFALLPNGSRSVSLFAAGSSELYAFNQIDGRTTIREVVKALVEYNHCDQDEAFKAVQSLILRLIQQGVCRPANPLA